MEPPWASSTASSLQQLACQRPSQGLGPRGEPPIPTGMPSCRPMAPGLRGSSSGGPRHKLAWSRDGGDPKSLAHSFYRRAAARLPAVWQCVDVPSRQLHPSKTHQRYLSTYLPTVPTYPARVIKKRGPVLGGGLERGVRGGQPSFTKEKCPDPKRFLARRRLLELTLTFTVLRYLRLQRH